MPDIASSRIGGRVGLLVIAVLALALAGGQAPSPAPTALESSIDLLVREDRVDSALVLLRDTLAVDSLNPRWHLRLAHLQKLKGQRAARRATLDRLLRIQRRPVEAQLELAQDFFDRGALDSAAYFGHAALASSGRRSAGAYYWLGRTHEQAGHADSALTYYRNAWLLLPSGGLD